MMQAARRIVTPGSKDEVQRLRGICRKMVPCRQKRRENTMKQARNVAPDFAMVCLALGVVSIIAISPARAGGPRDTSANIAPALKCADLTGWKIPSSTIVVTK